MSNFIDVIINKGLEAFGRYYGTYRGIVTADTTEDEQNRVSVIIPSICTNPILAYPKSQEGNTDSGFKWFTPIPGQVVYVEFIQGDLAYPLWSYHGWAKNEIPEELNGNSVMGFKSKRGHLFTLNEDTNELVLDIRHEDEKAGTKLSISGNSISLVTYNGDESESTEISISEKVMIKSDKDIKLSTDKKVIFNEGSSPMLISESLVSKVNDIENDLNALKAAMKTAAPGVLAMVPTFESVQRWSTRPALTKTKVSDVSNKNITQ